MGDRCDLTSSSSEVTPWYSTLANPYSILAGPGGEGLDTLGSLVGRLVRAAQSVLLQWQPGEGLTVLGGSGLQLNRRLKGARTHKVATA